MTDRADTTDIKKDVNRGLAWIGLASSLVWALDIIANVIILALWVSPGEYGVAVLAITLFPIIDLAAELGLTAAVIQRDDHTEEKISTVFWLNMTMTIVLAGLLAFAVGPTLSHLHGEPILRTMLAVYAIRLLTNNVYQIPVALMRKELRFKELSGVRTFANVAEFTGKVGSAAAGVGIWCFVFGPMCRSIGYGIGAQLCNPWRPRFVFRLREALDWAVYGLKTTASQMLFHIYSNIDYQVVGYTFGPQANGFYRLAYEIVLEPCRIISSVVTQIAFPAYARLKRDREKLIEQFITFTRMNLIIVLPFLSIVVISVDDLLVTFWGPRWAPAATAARILCAAGALRALSFIVPPLLDGTGRPGLTLVYTAIAAIVLPASFVASAHFFGDELGYLSVALAWAVGYPIAFAVLAALALGVLELRAVDYVRRIWGIVACAGIATGASAVVSWLAQPMPASLRLAASAATMIGCFLLLLAYLQGISPRSIKRALKD